MTTPPPVDHDHIALLVRAEDAVDAVIALVPVLEPSEVAALEAAEGVLYFVRMRLARGVTR